MSQEQPIRPQSEQEPTELHAQPEAPQDADAAAAVTQPAELEQTQKDGPTSAMQSAANRNEKAENNRSGRRIISESVEGQVVGHYDHLPGANFEPGNITIGEALEATALTLGHKPVDYSDAAAIQAAEVRATGRTNIVPGGVAAAAQSAATRNARTARDEDKTKLADILTDAAAKLPADKAVTRRDAEGVIGAELRNDPNLTTRPGGVAASVAAAARINQSK
ncbi:late embryogenesis abundant protein 47-like [Cornus florida]|uniref:late embryogenesis abundant protein 47-like n=1 Tax=Cornus florida TaxID=4283 RepID=UPI0028A0A541|nr:late embryogenesis abundant protein 47-like [Cornus florida]